MIIIILLLLVGSLTLGCLEISNMETTMSLMVERFQSSGQLQRPFTIASTPLPVIFGAMAVSSMRYGHWDANHFMISLILRYLEPYNSISLYLYYFTHYMYTIGFRKAGFRLSPPSPTWLLQKHLPTYD